ncbi:hypothetical protein MIMGU_mgv1a0149362mg, partial [Erythranthe guttata]
MNPHDLEPRRSIHHPHSNRRRRRHINHGDPNPIAAQNANPPTRRGQLQRAFEHTILHHLHPFVDHVIVPFERSSRLIHHVDRLLLHRRRRTSPPRQHPLRHIPPAI